MPTRDDNTKANETTQDKQEQPASKPTDGSEVDTSDTTPTQPIEADTTDSVPTQPIEADVPDEIPPPSFLTPPVPLDSSNDTTSQEDATTDARQRRRKARPSFNDTKAIYAIEANTPKSLPKEELDSRRDEAVRAQAVLEAMLPQAAAEFNLGKLVSTILDICHKHRDNALRGGTLNSERLLKELAEAVAEPEVLESVPYPQRLPDGKRAHNKDPLRIAKMGVGVIAQLIYISNNQHKTGDVDRLLPAAVVKFIGALFSLDEGSGPSAPEMGKIVRNAAESIREVEDERAEAEKERQEAEAKRKAEAEAKKKADAEAKRKPRGDGPR